MATMTIKNNRLKMSPGGIVTLTVAARKALGMKVNESEKVSVSTDRESVIITKGEGLKTTRISKSGQLELSTEAKELLLKSEKRHYWLELDDDKNQVRLMVY
ncbi:hypothetical protein [Dyadobacter sp. NIV53]|uniref:hypothetical protein n=1 Tax=Dyadobacter sp. NIV53 TaxID=2861765 RepID=UPI001C8734A2|nr:hypothetical protein [Dyadobacter sp. NIV53]